MTASFKRQPERRVNLMHPYVFYFFVLVLALRPSVGEANADLSVPNNNLNRALKYGPAPLRSLIERHLTMFPNSFPHQEIIYMPYLDRLIEHQRDLSNHLNSMPEYQDDFAKRGPLIDFAIEAEQDYEFRAKDFDRKNLDDWQARLTTLVQKKKEMTLIRLKNAIKEEVEEYLALAEAKFLAWSAEKDKEQFETMIVAAIMLYGITNHATDLSVFSKQIVLEEGHIDYLAEENLWRSALGFATKDLDENQTKIFWENALKIVRRAEKFLRNESAYGASSKLKQVRKGDKLFVYEVPPDLASLRGFVGNDCATSESFGFPYSPFERVYYVADAAKNFLGYLSLSIVEKDKDRALYFHTIAGPKITHEMTDLILRAIYKLRKEIGGNHVILPTDDRIGENINFSPIDQIMRRFAQNTPLKRVTWLDAKYRQVIYVRGSSSFYDSPERNSEGRVIEPNVDAIKVSPQKRNFETPAFVPSVAECATNFT